MPAVVAHQVVVITQIFADPDSDRFFTDILVNRTTDIARKKILARSFLESADHQHLAVHHRNTCRRIGQAVVVHAVLPLNAPPQAQAASIARPNACGKAQR
jgi:hypothetical protein